VEQAFARVFRITQTKVCATRTENLRLSKEEQDYAARLGSVKPTVLVIFLKPLSTK
jgi:hypothetical protein